MFKALLQKWPTFADAPKIQDRIVQAYERDRNMVAGRQGARAAGAPLREGHRLVPGQPEQPRRPGRRPAAVRGRAADRRHQHPRRRPGLPGRRRAGRRIRPSMAQCQEMYRTSAELYEKYLAAYPNSKRAYEYSLYYADALYYSRAVRPRRSPPTPRCATRCWTTASSATPPSTSSRSYEEIIERMKAARQLEDPPIPDETNTKPPVTAAGDARRLPEVPGGPRLVHGQHQRREDPRPALRRARSCCCATATGPRPAARLSQITDTYCGTKPEIGFKAYDALLKTYFIDFNVQDEEQQDCALGRLLAIADQFTESACSKNPAAAPYLARIQQIRTSVKSKVITKRLELAIENEEKGTERQLTVCREGGGGIAMVTGTGAQTGAPGHRAAARDAGAGGARRPGLDRDGRGPGPGPDRPGQPEPPGPGRPQEPEQRLRDLRDGCTSTARPPAATSGWRRDYPDSGEGKDAVWNAAKNNERFFNFNAAVDGYHQDRRGPEVRRPRAPQGRAGAGRHAAGQRPAVRPGRRRCTGATPTPWPTSPRTRPRPSTSRCNAYEKMSDTAKQRQCLHDLNKRYGTQPEAGEYVVESYLKLAAAGRAGRRQERHQPGLPEGARRVRAAARLPAGHPGGGRGRQGRVPAGRGEVQRLQGPSRSSSPTAKQGQGAPSTTSSPRPRALQDEYKRVWDYKDATWTTGRVPAPGRHLLRVRPEADQGGGQPAGRRRRRWARRPAGPTPACAVRPRPSTRTPSCPYVTPVEDVAKTEWKATLERAAQLGVTNEYVKKARENLSKYLPDEFPFVKDERPAAGAAMSTCRRFTPGRCAAGRARRWSPLSRRCSLGPGPAAQPAAAPARRRPRARKRRQPPPAVIPVDETAAAQKQYSAGNYEAAVAQAKAALTKNDKYTPAMLVMAKAYYKLRKYEWVRHLVEDDAGEQRHRGREGRDVPPARLDGDREEERPRAPSSMLKKATEARPENPVLWNNLGAQYLEAKNYKRGGAGPGEGGPAATRPSPRPT